MCNVRMEEETVTMYRPCGEKELMLVAESGFTAWLARLPDQPIFYPITNEKYAIEVTQWNARQSGKGFVTIFKVKKAFIDKYPIQTVGGHYHTEWWIPAEELEEFNI